MAHLPTHLSFDAWNTLFCNNPQFAFARNEYLAKRFNTTVNFAAAVYTHFKSLADKIAAEFGYQYETSHLYDILTKTFNPDASVITACEVRDDIQALFRLHPPLFDAKLVLELRKARQNGISMNVLSNTNFISGHLLRDTVFREWEEHYDTQFNYLMFSNVEGKAKPSLQFFDLMVLRAEMEHMVGRDDIMHIGDHEVCDIQGARAAGIRVHKVANPAETLLFMKVYNAA